ncbi:MAG: peptidase M20 [Desulfotalea sp.]|nr:MAG: peptidase M20 [Desulfotalea sp.]
MSWKKIIEAARSNRLELHKIPEPCWQERKTFAYLVAALDEYNIHWRPCSKTGLLAYFAQGAAGAHIALRADMDGLLMDEENDLPYRSEQKGCMHACGHDGHMAVMLATAQWLKVNEEKLLGPVTLIFQPAEEGGYGAREMIADGALDGVDKIFGWHNWPAIPYGKGVCCPGTVMAANASFSIVVKGHGGHASQPDICNDPVLAAAAITLGLQQIVSRRLPPQEAAVVSVTSIDAKSGKTVIPGTAILEGTVRMASTKGLERIGELLKESACFIAKGYGVTALVTYSPRYPAVVNSAGAAAEFGGCLAKVWGKDYQDHETAIPLMASEDFSYYLNNKPGAFALIGAGDGERFSIPCHNTSYNFNDRLIEPMLRAFSLVVGIPFPE